MDTPDRSKIFAPPISHFEDSPVFNFINNLSPIQPVKSVDSVHVAHTYQNLNFTSLSSIFSSPHANSQKESRTLIRGFPDSVRSLRCNAIAHANQTKQLSVNEDTANSTECLVLSNEVIGLTKYDAGSPNHNTTLCHGFKVHPQLNVGHVPVELVDSVQDDLEKQEVIFATQAGIEENCLHEHSKEEAVECDWENLISVGDGAEDLLIFDYPIGSEVCQQLNEKEVDVASVQGSVFSKPKDDADNQQTTQPDILDAPCIQNASQDLPLNCCKDIIEEDDIEHVSTETSVKQVDKQQQRGIRRRCLHFEVAGASKRNMHNDSNCAPSLTKGKSISNDKNLKSGIIASPCVVPGIGLHLNTVATTSKDRMNSKESFASGKHLINNPRPVGLFPPTPAGVKTLSKSLAMEKDLHTGDTEVADIRVLHDETSQDAAVVNCEELSQGSPKKKRRKLENGVESDGCKRCNCKKSKCLKLYCECFAAGVYCSEPCTCQGCFNKPVHEETVLATRKQIESRNPLAFAPKVIRTLDTGHELREDDNKTPASARHKRGCNCKKSNCLKKYCECYQGGVGCSLSCRCEGCKNAYGRKEGILPICGIDQAEEEPNACRKAEVRLDDVLEHANVHIDEYPSSDSVLPITPSLEICRLSVDVSFFSSAKSLRSSKLMIGSSPGFCGSSMFQKSEILLSQDSYDRNVNTILEDDTPTILRATSSPVNRVKISSPNSKRVSPPHNAVVLTPNRKGGRRLILKSIPSFPSLSNDVSSECPVNYSSSPSSSSAFK